MLSFVRAASFFVFFFFKQKTAYEITHSDWSSDVCSSDLPHAAAPTWRDRSCHDEAARLRDRRLPGTGAVGGAGRRRRGGALAVAVRARRRAADHRGGGAPAVPVRDPVPA